MKISPLFSHVALRALPLWLVTRAVDVLLTLTTSGDRLDHWRFWDALFYGTIASNGYAPNDARLAAYFPLYPSLVHVGMWAGASYEVMALLVSNLALLAALIVVGLLGHHEGLGSWLPMLLLAVSPLGVFLSGMYADGLFVALAAGTLLAVRSGHWRVAGPILALAVITRPFGLVLALAVVIYAFTRLVRWRDMLWLVTPSELALAAWMIVLSRIYHDPLVFLHVETTRWGHAYLWPWQTLALQVQQFIVLPAWRMQMLLDILTPLACLLIAVLMVRRWPPLYTGYTLLIVLLCLISPVVVVNQFAMVSDARYCYAAVPVLLTVAGWLKWWPRRATAVLLAASFALQIGLTGFELHGGWLV